MRSFRVSSADIDEIRRAYEAFLFLNEVRLSSSCGLFGFSYGAGPTLIAASRPAIREKVRFLVSFGGYYDLRNVLSFIATGHFEYGGRRYFHPPQEYGKWVFLASNRDWVRSARDRAVLTEIVQKKLRDEKARIDLLIPQLGPERKTVLALLSHNDFNQTEKILNDMRGEIRSTLDSLSVAATIKDLRADLILAHGEGDDLIPFTETLRLAQNAPDRRKVSLRILKSYAHMDPEKQEVSFKNIIMHQIPEAWKLLVLVYQLMGYRDE